MQDDKNAFDKIQRVLKSETGYSDEKMPNKDFIAYIGLLKNATKENIPAYDRYTYYKEALPKNIKKINDNLKKAFKKEE